VKGRFLFAGITKEFKERVIAAVSTESALNLKYDFEYDVNYDLKYDFKCDLDCLLVKGSQVKVNRESSSIIPR
jgi:hypothetical protein